MFDGIIPEARPQDAHDVLGTYEALTNPEMTGRQLTDVADFTAVLLHHHRTIMHGRPDKRPGQFKLDANRAGNTRFVDPDLVEGILTEGFARLAELDTGFERAVYMMFLIAEVHPFDDGNRRTARVMMNSELDLYHENRIIVPTVFRTNYFNGLRRLSRDDASVLIKALRYAHDYTNAIDFTDFDRAVEQLIATNAFEDAEAGMELVIPSFGDGDLEPKRRPAGGRRPAGAPLHPCRRRRNPQTASGTVRFADRRRLGPGGSPVAAHAFGVSNEIASRTGRRNIGSRS